jgi:hypothetical protein
MYAERPFVNTHDPEVLYTKSKKELFRDVIEAEHNGIKLDMADYLSAYLNSGGYTLRVEKGDLPEPNKPLIFALNHHSRQRFFTTEESLRAVAIASVSARDAGVTDKHIAWMVRHLPIPQIGIGKMARQVQNATGTVFDSVPAKTVKKLSVKDFIPRFRETMTETDANWLISTVASRVQNNNALGSFPEQEPTFELRPFHRNFPRTLGALKLLTSDYQIATLACFYEGNVARAVYGPIVEVSKDSNEQDTATKVMQGIAYGMPKSLRGPYA